MAKAELVFMQNGDVDLLGLFWFLMMEWDRKPYPRVRRGSDSRRYHRDYITSEPGFIEHDVSTRMNGSSILFERNPKMYSRATVIQNGVVEHMCLWSKDGALSQDEIVVELEKRLGPDAAYLLVVNPKEIQSAPGMWHAQVFVKNE